MAINFKLKPRWVTTEDPMGRDWAGWDPDATDEENFAHNRGVWLIGRRGESERYATFSLDGRVVLAAAISGIEEIHDPRPDRADKRAVVGRVLSPSDREYAWFIGRIVDGHRNP